MPDNLREALLEARAMGAPCCILLTKLRGFRCYPLTGDALEGVVYFIVLEDRPLPVFIDPNAERVFMDFLMGSIGKDRWLANKEFVISDDSLIGWAEWEAQREIDHLELVRKKRETDARRDTVRKELALPPKPSTAAPRKFKKLRRV